MIIPVASFGDIENEIERWERADQIIREKHGAPPTSPPEVGPADPNLYDRLARGAVHHLNNMAVDISVNGDYEDLRLPDPVQIAPKLNDDDLEVVRIVHDW